MIRQVCASALVIILGTAAAAAPPVLRAPAQDAAEQVFKFDFRQGLQGWVGGFADFPVGAEEFFELEVGLKPLPAYLLRGRRGERGGRRAGRSRTLFLSGNNHSDDLFMFIKRPLSGLKPLTRYEVRFNLQIASNAPSGCAGAGGAPGESVYLKVGGSAAEPLAVAENGTYRLNVDKGNQSQGGQAAVVLGNIANGLSDCRAGKALYQFKSLNGQGKSLELVTDSNGVLWLIIGTDSGFESTTALYYTRVEVTLREL